MIKEFIPYNEALELKELGFYCDCFGDYFKFGNQNPFLVTDEDRYRIEEDNQGEDILRVPAPTYSQAFRWFRKTYNLHPHFFLQPDSTYVWCIRWFEGGRQKDANTYEEAELACLRKLIEIVKND